MLKGIPKIISPALLKALCEMGHGDTLVIADGNFPAESVGKNALVIRYDAVGVTPLLKAILELFPLDTYVEKPVSLMAVVPGDKVETPIWEEYKAAIRAVDPRGNDTVENIERFAFYEKAKDAYLVIATSESALYANIILQKGVVKE